MKYTTLFILALLLAPLTLHAQTAKRDPDIGYVYPAGGQQGSCFEILIGGQYLRSVRGAQVSGEGVTVRLKKYYQPIRNLDKEQRQALQGRFREALAKRIEALPPDQRPPAFPQRKWVHRGEDGTVAEDTPAAEAVELPEHPLLEEIEKKSLHELIALSDIFFDQKKRQKNKQLDEMVRLEVRIDQSAPAGNRALRLETAGGLSNALCFQVNTLLEIREVEPNGPRVPPWLPDLPPSETPVLINGQIRPGDVDRFAFHASAGQDLVIHAAARELVPYLADAVPGWFQATLTLYDAQGEKLAFADDYHFDPDPVLPFHVAETGVYYLEIRDAIYRGREDFVYRIAISEAPFITSAFPLGAQQGSDAASDLKGLNLPAAQATLDTRETGIFSCALTSKEGLSNPLFYAVDSLPDLTEKEPNNLPAEAGAVSLSTIINGRIDHSGDVDCYRLELEAGSTLVANVQARQLHSPLDAVLYLCRENGEVLTWADDYNPKEGHVHLGAGWCTHHADPLLSAPITESGVYLIRIVDATGTGGDAYAYRLRLSPPQPDFDLFITPSTLQVTPGRPVPMTAYLLRKEGFAETVTLAAQEKSGFRVDGGEIPAGVNKIRLTLTPIRKAYKKAFPLQLEGIAPIGAQTLRHKAIPVDETMQAFLYRHLPRSEALWVHPPTGRRKAPPMRITPQGRITLTPGEAVSLLVKTYIPEKMRALTLTLDAPPEGISLREVQTTGRGIRVALYADPQTAPGGLNDNLIIRAEIERTLPEPHPKTGAKNIRVDLGYLPAIPIHIAP